MFARGIGCAGACKRYHGGARCDAGRQRVQRSGQGAGEGRGRAADAGRCRRQTTRRYRAAAVSDPAGSPERWLDEHGSALYRYALVRTRDEHKAEELVQETFLAALQARERFA
ncbi:MAG: hypothetical protein HZB57_13000, partial [Gammaproteobacteria bacterium]|nr:hypothetical protein [Gammaproteobacteria bacterium]